MLISLVTFNIKNEQIFAQFEPRIKDNFFTTNFTKNSNNITSKNLKNKTKQSILIKQFCNLMKVL